MFNFSGRGVQFGATYSIQQIAKAMRSDINLVAIKVSELNRQGCCFREQEYGMNWDAFWDCLTDMVSDPMHIELIGMERVQNKFPRHAKIMLDILKRLKHWNNDKYKDQIEIEIVIGEARYEIR